MRYEDRIVDEVQTANDIVEVISQYLPLKRAGRNFKANCPFHSEKTPSFMVNPEKQIFHCFGCSAGGDVFTFVMRSENMSFPEALRRLAERAHIRLPEASFKKEGAGPSESEQLYEVYRQAVAFYQAQYKHPQMGKAAREYWASRGFDPQLAEEFQIGWAADGWRGLFEFLSKKGFPNSLLLKSGLIARSSQGQPYDIFRSRLLFPIFNLQGKGVAFGGRLITKAENQGPKYLNSPETAVFHKRRELYGLNLAKKFIDHNFPRILIVEGYLDFLRLYEKGFKYTVATLGTSLTPDHVKILKRFAEEAIVVYDGDAAGEAASLRGLEVFLEGQMNVKLVKLPKGQDPDDFLKKEGREAFEKMLAQAQDFFDFQMEILQKRYNRSDSLGLMKMTGEFLESFTKISHPVLLDRYLKRLAGALGVEENSLRSELAKLKKKISERNIRPAESTEEKKSFSSVRNLPASQEEILLLSLMVEDAELRQNAFAELVESHFDHPSSRETFRILLAMEENNAPITLAKILSRLEDAVFKEKMTAFSSISEDGQNKKKAFWDCLRQMKKRRLEKRLEELRRLIHQAEKLGDSRELAPRIKEYQELLQQVKE